MNEIPKPSGWLNRTVIGAGITSFLADVCYEMASAVLPGFLIRLQMPAFALTGLLEGTADAVANFAKLGVGWYSDRIGRRKPFVVFGYALTGFTQSLYALAFGFPLIFLAKVLGWIGKGIRGPLRNVILSDAVSPEDRGKAFGLHRAGDSLGAVVGPLIAYVILSRLPPESYPDATDPYRFIFWLTLIPGVGAALAFALLIRERPHAENSDRRLFASIRSLPKPFHRLLLGVGVFGAGDYSIGVVIVASMALMQPTLGTANTLALGPLLYAWRNGVQSLASFPAGWLGDRFGPRRPLVVGYFLAVVVTVGFAIVFEIGFANQTVLFALFALNGIYLAIEDALESVLTANLVSDRTLRGTAFGLMGSVNGCGDLIASLLVGFLMQSVSPLLGLGCAAGLMLVGTVLLMRVR